ncbi:MAG: hypothetical protein P8185_05755 [Deltaproteobacteria bacterium]
MKLLIITIAIAGLFLLPMRGFGKPVYTATSPLPVAQNTTAVKPPPVAQGLVREGNFAVKLAETLNLGEPQSEGAAESMLSSSGIAPDNGWIADYPVTPAIIGQLQNSIQAAIDSGKLAMSRDSALAALQTVSDDFSLNIVVAGAGSHQSAGESPLGSGVYVRPSVVNNYYYDNGPPVITYYAPPSAYLFLYAWVPAPFWWGGFYFPGFFILNDFNRVIVVHHRREICTNHIFDRRVHRFLLIDPVNGRHYRSVNEFPHYNRLEARRGGEAIQHHARPYRENAERGTAPEEFSGSNIMPSGSGKRIGRQAAPQSRGRAIQPMYRSHEESHFFSGRSNPGNNGHRGVAGPPSGFERHYRPPLSNESQGRTGSFSNQGTSGEFHGHRDAGFPGGETGHERFGNEFHGHRYAGFPGSGMRHPSSGGRFHGGDFRR